MKTIKARERSDEPVTDVTLEQAIARGRQRQTQGVHATRVQYLPSFNSLYIGFADQSGLTLPVGNYPELAGLTTEELMQLVPGFGGSALCLEARDLHVSIAGLVSASQPLMDVAATVIAARNGSRSSAAKAEAARENGHKGGRPRKQAAG